MDRPVVPDPSDGWACLRYIDAEAAAGHVGTTADRAVLKYLVQNTWRRKPDDERQSVGQVSIKMAAVKMIAQTTGLSRFGVQKCLRKLEKAGWLYLEQMTFDNNQCAASLIMVKLDLAAHRDREKTRDLAKEMAELVASMSGSANSVGRGGPT